MMNSKSHVSVIPSEARSAESRDLAFPTVAHICPLLANVGLFPTAAGGRVEQLCSGGTYSAGTRQEVPCASF